MSIPEQEQILLNMEVTLSGIVAGNPYPPTLSGTYNYTPKVTHDPVAPEECTTFPTYLVVAGEESYIYKGKRVVNNLNVLVRCFHSGEKGIGTAMEKRTGMVRDVLAAMSGDVSRGGIAGNTEAINTVSDEGWIAPYIAAEITFRVTYYTLELNR